MLGGMNPIMASTDGLVPGWRRPAAAVVIAATAAMAVLTGLVVVGEASSQSLGAGLLWLDVAAGVASVALLPALYTRWPVPAALALAVLAAVSPAATPAATAATLQVALSRPFRVAAWVAAAGAAGHAVRGLWRPQAGLSYGWWLLLVVAVQAAILGCGALVHANRALIAALRERASRAEAEQARRVAEARLVERTRMAREMHDVLAHRLSLLATYAGALEYRPDAPPAQLSRAAAVIRDGAHQALEELRDVIGVLRDEPGDPGPGTVSAAERPQPTLADLPRLASESTEAGHAGSAGDHAPGRPAGPARHRPHRLPDRPGGADQCPQARGRPAGPADRVGHAGRGPGHRHPQPAGRRPGRPWRDTRQRHRADRAGRARPAGGRADRVRPGRPRVPAPGLAAVDGMSPGDMSPGGGRPGPIRVLIVDDDPLVRSALAMMLGGSDEIEVAAEAADGDEVEAAADAHTIDVALMDIRMSRVDGVEATRRLRARSRPPEVIVLTTFDADELVLRALRAGASGYLLKDSQPARIVAAIRQVAAGEPILSPAITRRLIGLAAAGHHEAEQARRAIDGLTAREREVVLGIAAGKSNADLAGELYMSVATVKAHVSHVLAKLGLDNRTQIALLAHDAGLA